MCSFIFSKCEHTWCVVSTPVLEHHEGLTSGSSCSKEINLIKEREWEHHLDELCGLQDVQACLAFGIVFSFSLLLAFGSSTFLSFSLIHFSFFFLSPSKLFSLSIYCSAKIKNLRWKPQNLIYCQKWNIAQENNLEHWFYERTRQKLFDSIIKHRSAWQQWLNAIDVILWENHQLEHGLRLLHKRINVFCGEKVIRRRIPERRSLRKSNPKEKTKTFCFEDSNITPHSFQQSFNILKSWSCFHTDENWEKRCLWPLSWWLHNSQWNE